MEILKNNKSRSLNFILIFVLFNLLISCTDSLLHPRPSRKEFETQFPTPYGSSNSKLNTDAVYVNNTIVENDPEFFTYLSFKKSGTVIWFSNTSMNIDTLAKYQNIWNPELSKKGIPKDSHCDFGFYKTVNDSLFAKIHVGGMLGSWDYYDIKAQIYNDSVVAQIRKTGTGANTEKAEYSDKTFYLKKIK